LRTLAGSRTLLRKARTSAGSGNLGADRRHRQTVDSIDCAVRLTYVFVRFLTAPLFVLSITDCALGVIGVALVVSIFALVVVKQPR
jgi:hypothetical protein